MKKLLAAGVALAVLVIVAAVAAYAYDRSRAEVLAEGVKVADVDVGGMTTREARATLERELVPRVERPVTARYKKKAFVLSPSGAGVKTDVEGMVEAAVAKSREGTFAGRAFRDVVGGTVDANVPLQVSYSRAAVAEFVRDVARAIERRPRDAKVTPSPTSLRVTPSRNGLAVRSRELTSEIVARLVDPDAAPTVEVRTEVKKPKVTTAGLRSKYENYLTISRAQKKLRLFEHLKLTKVYEIAIGKQGYTTPAGVYEIETKAVNPAWHAPDEEWAGKLAGKIVPPGSPDNPIKARWMEFYNGAGIHGTDDVASIGTAASHGCIRMTIPDVIELYNRIPIGTPVYIG